MSLRFFMLLHKTYLFTYLFFILTSFRDHIKMNGEQTSNSLRRQCCCTAGEKNIHVVQVLFLFSLYPKWPNPALMFSLLNNPNVGNQGRKPAEALEGHHSSPEATRKLSMSEALSLCSAVNLAIPSLTTTPHAAFTCSTLSSMKQMRWNHSNAAPVMTF